VVRLGQNLLTDTNLLEAIVREAAPARDDVVLEVGPGPGALTGRLAARVATVHAIELDRRFESQLQALAESHSNLRVHWGDAMRLELGELEPHPTAVVSNLPYSIATPMILRTIVALPQVTAWTVMVQREIAERFAAKPGSRAYGAPSVLVQLACQVHIRRTVDPAVFAPRPRVQSALLRLDRLRPAASERVAAVVRAGFAHRRKALARSLELAGMARADEARTALAAMGMAERSRAEALAPCEFALLAERLGG